jgi:monovalent cation:H+ antiporter-2, CPA2 family
VLAVIMLGKSLVAVAIVLAFKHPIGTALTIAASLAQIGEFSFILVGLGLSLNILPAEGRDLILGGALLSITLNPFVFALAETVTGFFARRPSLAARFQRRDGVSTEIATGSSRRGQHAVIVGYGRVGSVITEAMKPWGLPHVVVDGDQRKIQQLRANGIDAVFGDASSPGILHAANIERARLLIVATPDSYQARRQIEIAREANPAIDIVVRTHSENERRKLKELGVGLVLMAERELAFGMLQYALHSMGVPEGDAQAFVAVSRTEEPGGQAARPDLEQKTPELRFRGNDTAG